jgi:hypothetical protein
MTVIWKDQVKFNSDILCFAAYINRICKPRFSPRRPALFLRLVAGWDPAASVWNCVFERTHCYLPDDTRINIEHWWSGDWQGKNRSTRCSGGEGEWLSQCHFLHRRSHINCSAVVPRISRIKSDHFTDKMRWLAASVWDVLGPSLLHFLSVYCFLSIFALESKLTAWSSLSWETYSLWASQ